MEKAGLEQKDSGDGRQLPDIDTVPDYTYTTFIAAGTTTKWKYRAIYIISDDRVGQWSDEVVISGGVVILNVGCFILNAARVWAAFFVLLFIDRGCIFELTVNVFIHYNKIIILN